MLILPYATTFYARRLIVLWLDSLHVEKAAYLRANPFFGMVWTRAVSHVVF